jgi:glutamate formiminotransferase/formiminotetrahydrofolate cyclodeaminase
MWQVIEQADALRAKLLDTMQQDSAAFEAWMTANRLPKETDEQQTSRLAAIELAAQKAIEVPLQTAQLALEAMQFAAECAETANLNAISDAGSAGELANAAITAAGYNVRINCLGLTDTKAADDYLSRIRKIELTAAGTLSGLRNILSTRGNFPLN